MRERRNHNNQAAKVLLVGSGSWATALLKILLFNKKDVYWWIRKKETIDFISAYRHNPKYLSSVDIALDNHKMSNDLKTLIHGKDVVILAVPSAFVVHALAQLSPEDFKNKIVVSAIKGTVGNSNQSLFEYMVENFKISRDKYVAITGPCHAEEVAAERLSYLTFSSNSATNASYISRLFDNRFIKTNLSSDVVGTEYAAILKNIYAILAGICQGVGMGDNFQSVLVSNAMQEMKRFLDKTHPMERNLLETCYMGDLLVTAYSQFSRNRTFGRMVGKGYGIKSAQIEMDMVAEGYYATKSIYEIAQAHKIATPLIDSVFHILYHNVAPSIEISLLSSLLNQPLD
ncbi:glycerol-3-phosphate dehydrogenase [bacterium]|nr:glycerol-3-phosphate dehydrogenase [bacterium]